MGRIDRKENIRVEVEAGGYMRITRRSPEEQMVDACEGVAAQIRRHVDGLGSVRVMWDTAGTCEHCGAQWTEDSPDYNGGCCDADEDNNPEPEGD